MCDDALRKVGRGFSHGTRWLADGLGFKKGYNVVLYIIFAGALMGFSLARLPYLNVPGVFCKGTSGAAPGECFYYRRGKYHVGIILHLGCILPASMLACFQFLPVIRHRFLTFHRLSGYVIILLCLVSNVGAILITRRTFGGSISTQTALGLLTLISTVSICMAYYNIKRLQIDQHRAWMLRAFFYMACIITIRLIMIISAMIVTRIGSYYQIWPCEKLDWLLRGQNRTLARYPSCAPYYSGGHPSQPAAVLANFNSDAQEELGAALGVSFGMASWLAMFLHGVGVEIYIRLTPGESCRLRQISYERQLEAGFDNPGNAGLTIERLGDMDGACGQRFSSDKSTNEQELEDRFKDDTSGVTPNVTRD